MFDVQGLRRGTGATESRARRQPAVAGDWRATGHHRIRSLHRRRPHRLDRWEIDLDTAIPGDLRDTSTPQALDDGIQNLLTGTVLGEPQRRQLDDWMRGNATSALSIRAGLPPGWTTADKTGTGDYGSANDIGIAYGPNGQRVLLLLMTRSQSPNSNADALRPLTAEVTRSVLPWLIGQG